MNEIAFIAPNPVQVLTDAKTYSEFYDRVKAEVSAHVPDVSTATGRKNIASLAYKVTRSKTAIDEAGKKLNEDARAKINAVDAQRRKIRDELDALADEIRQPLTEWEAAEEARQTLVREFFDDLRRVLIFGPATTVDELEARLGGIGVPEAINKAVFLERFSEAHEAHAGAVVQLETAIAIAKKQLADAAELARLRAEAEAREIADRTRQEAERAAKDAAEKEAREKAEYAETVKRQAEAAERAQKEAAERERLAAENARIEAERAARAENERIERGAREAVAKAEAEARRVTEAAERAERERQEAAERIKREDAARQADREHRGKIMGEAKTALIEIGAGDDLAKKIVLAIVAGEIPHVSLRF